MVDLLPLLQYNARPKKQANLEGKSMNSYQKFSVFVLRALGTAVAIFGIQHLATSDQLFFYFPTVQPTAAFWSGIGWTLAGVFVIILAKPAGRLFGHGLD